MTATADDNADATTGRPKRRRRRIVALSVFALLAIALFVVTRPSVLASFVLPAASRAIGGEVTAARVALDGTSEIVIEDLLVRAPGWDGEGGEVARADRIRIRFSP